MMKVGIVGAGRVGAICALALVTRGSAREIVIVDRTRARTKAVVTDLRYGAPLCAEVTLRDGDYADLEGADVVLIAAGVNEKSGGATDRGEPEGRLRLRNHFERRHEMSEMRRVTEVDGAQAFRYATDGKWRVSENHKPFDAYRPCDRSVCAPVAAARAFAAWSPSTFGERTTLFFEAAGEPQ